MTPTHPTLLPTDDLGTMGYITPGVYFFSSSGHLEGIMRLDGQGNSSALFVFQVRRGIWGRHNDTARLAR